MDKEFLVGTIAVVICVCTFIVSFPVYYMAQDVRLTEMVRAGADPIRAACAVRGISTSPMCVGPR